jgi:hypothetical protein
VVSRADEREFPLGGLMTTWSEIVMPCEIFCSRRCGVSSETRGENDMTRDLSMREGAKD